MLIPALHSLVLMIGVVGVIVGATLITLWLRWGYPQHDHQELVLRVRSWWWIILVVFLVLLLPLPYPLISIALLSLLALREFLALLPFSVAQRRILIWVYLAIPIQYFWIAIGWYGMFIIFIPVYAFLILPLLMALFGETRGFIYSAGVTLWLLMLAVFCISHMAFLLMLPIGNKQAGAIGLVLFLLVATQLNDVCQYLWGHAIGHYKIVPRISPNKTWEGFIGGAVTITLLSYWLAPYLTPLDHIHGVIAGGIIAISGFCGDVVISAVKRDLSIKDTGNMLPGHGGILDRIDSLMFTAPLFFHYLYFLHY